MRTACFLAKCECGADEQRDPECRLGYPGSMVPECKIESEERKTGCRMCAGEAGCGLEAKWSCSEQSDMRARAAEVLQIPRARHIRDLLQAAYQPPAERYRDEHVYRGPTRSARSLRDETHCERRQQRDDDHQHRLASTPVQQHLGPPAPSAEPELQRIVVGPGVREAQIDRCRCKQQHQRNTRGQRQRQMSSTKWQRCSASPGRQGVRSNR